jgi:hypothetical protein
MHKQDLAILFSGGTDSLALYGLAAAGHHQELQRPHRIHLLHMLNGMSRFHDFPAERLKVAKAILAKRTDTDWSEEGSGQGHLPETLMVELDMGRLFQGLWLDRFEELMPRYGGKNLVCVACKLAMHAQAIIYCLEHFVPLLAAGYARRQEYYPEQTPVFMEKVKDFSEHFGIQTRFPVYDEFDDQMVTRQVLEDFGLPSTGGGERKCLFCQTLTTASSAEIGKYLDDMIPRVTAYIEHRQAGRIKKAAGVFPPGNIR